MSETTLAPFCLDHLSAAQALSQAEGWPHRIEDWTMLFHLSRGVVALSGDQVVGTALATPFGPDMATANMIIVAKQARGQGIGQRLMEAILEDVQTCRLVATPDGQPLYAKLGFEACGEILQFQAKLETAPSAASDVRWANEGEIAQVAALESAQFGADRSALVAWLGQNAQLFVVLGSDGEIIGYTCLRSFGRGYVIGPLAAPDLTCAKALISTAASGMEGQFLRIDTDPAAGLVPWLKDLGLAQVGSGVTMQRSVTGAANPATRYALFSQALG